MAWIIVSAKLGGSQTSTLVDSARSLYKAAKTKKWHSSGETGNRSRNTEERGFAIRIFAVSRSDARCKDLLKHQKYLCGINEAFQPHLRTTGQIVSFPS